MWVNPFCILSHIQQSLLVLSLNTMIIKKKKKKLHITLNYLSKSLKSPLMVMWLQLRIIPKILSSPQCTFTLSFLFILCKSQWYSINISSPAINCLVFFVMQIGNSGCAGVCTLSFLSLLWHFCEATSGPSHWTPFDFSGEAALFLLGWCCHRHKTCMQCSSHSMKALHLCSPQVFSDWKRGLVDTAPIFLEPVEWH